MTPSDPIEKSAQTPTWSSDKRIVLSAFKASFFVVLNHPPKTIKILIKK